LSPCRNTDDALIPTLFAVIDSVFCQADEFIVVSSSRVRPHRSESATHPVGLVRSVDRKKRDRDRFVLADQPAFCDSERTVALIAVGPSACDVPGGSRVDEPMTKRVVLGSVLATPICVAAVFLLMHSIRTIDYTMSLPICRSDEDTFRIESPDAETLAVLRCSGTGQWLLVSEGNVEGGTPPRAQR
jgi:hypothetical protein